MQWEEDMGVTPRQSRVTAQRKFAQGAFVPHHTGIQQTPIIHAPPDRRGQSSTSRDQCILRYNDMSAEEALDFLTFKNYHSHTEPIVLVERLPEQQAVVNIQPTQPTPKNKSPPLKLRRRTIVKLPPAHGMQLRSQRVAKATRSTKSQISKSSLLHNSKRRKIQDCLYKTKRKPQSKPSFSVDDNRPLKYLASSVKKIKTKPSDDASSVKLAYVNTSSDNPRGITRRKNVKKSLNSTERNAQSSAEQKPPKTSRSVVRKLTDNSDITEPVFKLPRRSNTQPQKAVEPVVNGAAAAPDPNINEITTEACGNNCDPDVLTESASCNTTNSLSYYSSEQGIHRWMDSYLPKESTSAPAMKSNSVIIIDDTEEIDRCPGYAWRTVNDVVNLSKAEYSARCKSCDNCKRIDKYETVCDILKKKCDKSILRKDTFDMDPIIIKSGIGSPDNINMSSHDQVIYMEMLPRHPSLMLKCKIKNINGQTMLYTNTIRRSNADVSVEFSFIEYEYVLNNWLQAFTANNNDFTLASDLLLNELEIKKDTEPTAGPSCAEVQCIKSLVIDDNEDAGKILNAPIFYPTVKEFEDPMSYFKQISSEAHNFGICKIVPPNNFTPSCRIDDNMKFEVFNQYISRLYNRWGPATKELCAMRNCMNYDNIGVSRPMIDGVEVNLPKLYHLVQHHGGLETVINKNKWSKVAEDMNLNKGASTAKKLDQIYVTYLLPYNALTARERQNMFTKVEKAWHLRNEKMLKRANNPLHHQKYLLGESDSSSDESEDDVTKDIEDCVENGQNMNVTKFKRISRNAQYQFFRDKAAPLSQIEQEYWRMVIHGTEHVCVNTASIDTAEQGIGFSTNKSDVYSNHKWNLKMLSQNQENILRSLGPVLGVTVPTLHLGMIFSTSCWHRDPHSIPWIDFQHTGPAKIWYSVPEREGQNFCNASKTLFPTSCQNKEMWLSSDISMIPPNLLAQQKVRVYRVEQNPGEFILVMPRAYSCSICTGYTVSESVYFAMENLLEGLIAAFKEIRKSCEPAMFALEQLLISIAEDDTSVISILRHIRPILGEFIESEINNRNHLMYMRVTVVKPLQSEGPPTSKCKSRKSAVTTPPPVWNVRDLDECEICRRTLYLSKVKHVPRNTFLCLEHSIRVLHNNNTKRAPVLPEHLEMHVVYYTEELQNILIKLQKRIELY